MQPITLTTQQIAKPVGIIPQHWQIYLRNSTGVITHVYKGSVPATTFTDVPNGAYTIAAARLDNADQVIGSEVTRDFTVTDGEMVDVPVSILVGGS